MKFYPAYTKGRPTYTGQITPGAYLIKHAGKIQYVGYSASNVLKTAYRHFQKWTDAQYRAVFPKRSELIIFPTKTAARAKQIEREFYFKLNPSKNKNTPEEYPF